MPRRAKVDAPVLPTRSLVASAARYPGTSARIYRGSEGWQRECYRHYGICGEARFAARFFGHALSRAVLGIGKKKDGKTQPVTSGPAVDYLEQLFNGKEGQEQMLEALGIHLTIAGDCYLVGRQVETVESVDGEDVPTGNFDEVWEVVSVLEMKVTGTKWTIDYGMSHKQVELTDEDVVIRIWIPSPGNRMEADSPFKSLLPILAEIEWLTRHVFAQVSSRLAGAGILFISQGISFPPPPEQAEGAAELNEADAFMMMLGDAMLKPLDDPGSPSAMIPVVASVPPEVLEKGDPAKLMHFWSELDAASMSLRQEAIRRFALGMELPPEQVLGMSSNSGTGGGASNGVSHWGAWQIEESTIKMFVEPMLQVIASAITITYLRPLVDDPAQVVTFNTSALRLRPDRSKEAFMLFDRGAINVDALIRENGFDPADKPSPEEFKQFMLVKIASGSATPEQVQAALAMLGVNLPIEQVPTADQVPREARPDPSLRDFPLPKAPPEAATLLAASEGLVFRALERVGNRIRQDVGVRPPGVRAFNVHTLHSPNGKTDKYLSDAWSCAPEVLEGIAPVEETVQVLDAYVRSLIAEQSPHSRDRLQRWLEMANA